MKKLLPFIFLLFFGLQYKGQVWCQPGAEWHYRISPNFFLPYQDGHLKLTFTNTVIINSIICDNIKGVYKGIFGMPSSPTITTNYVSLNIHKINNTVRFYNQDSNAFDTIVDFNAAIGDKWLLIRLTNTSPCSFNRPTVTVVDTGHVTINSIWLKKIVINYNFPSNPVVTDTIIEKMLDVNSFLFPSYQCVSDGTNYGKFRCYSDSNFPLYNPTADICDYVPTGVGINENSFSNSIFKLYPNPTNGIFNIELTEPINLKIYSSAGTLVFERTFDETGNFQLDISHLSNGIYNLRTESGKGASNAKLIKN